MLKFCINLLISVNNTWRGSYKKKKDPPFKKMKAETSSGKESYNDILMIMYIYKYKYVF